MLQKISQLIEKNASELEQWYKNKLKEVNPCLYTSVDLRYSGNKLVPVDTNIFPAGFNNLDQKELKKASGLFKEFITQNFSYTQNIILICEDHTRNLAYIDNIKSIQNLITFAGYKCLIGSITLTEKLTLNGNEHHEVEISPLTKIDGLLQIKDEFCPELIVLNNDLMLGFDEKLQNLKQKIVPLPENGWFKRRKSRHFTIYNELMQELERKFLIPSFYLTSEFSIKSSIDFKNRHGVDELYEEAKLLLQKLAENYLRFDIKEKPYLVIKSDYGTYGMGVMIIKDPEEIFQLNKKIRNQMSVTKSNVKNTQVIIQEGIKTIDKISNASAEPLLYLVNHQLVSFMYRAHLNKDEYSNLNSSGMNFHKVKNGCSAYNLCCEFVAKIAALAAAHEV